MFAMAVIMLGNAATVMIPAMATQIMTSISENPAVRRRSI
jgi:hypothetical protein